MRDCPNCGTQTKVTDSRCYSDGFIKRRRACPQCNHRHTTVEIPWDDDPRYAEQLQWVISNEPV